MVFGAMRTNPAYRKITADEFLNIDFGTDRRFELEDGVIVMMAGRSEPHAWVQGNIFSWLKNALKGSSCRPYGPDMAIRVSETDIRYPDVSVHCGPRGEDRAEIKALSQPVVIIEILSPNTATLDQGSKLEEYKLLPSVQTIAFVDPVNELVRTVQRTSEFGWTDNVLNVRDIEMPTLDLVIPYAEIFAED